MIVYKNILQKLSEMGWSTYRLQKEKIISNCVIGRIRKGLPITTVTIDTLCRLLNCQPGDIIEYHDEKGRD
jgi:putative transcriptional regulator